MITYFFTDLLEGADVITDFGQNADQDKIRSFGQIIIPTTILY